MLSFSALNGFDKNHSSGGTYGNPYTPITQGVSRTIHEKGRTVTERAFVKTGYGNSGNNKQHQQRDALILNFRGNVQTIDIRDEEEEEIINQHFDQIKRDLKSKRNGGNPQKQRGYENPQRKQQRYEPQITTVDSDDESEQQKENEKLRRKQKEFEKLQKQQQKEYEKLQKKQQQQEFEKLQKQQQKKLKKLQITEIDSDDDESEQEQRNYKPQKQQRYKPQIKAVDSDDSDDSDAETRKQMRQNSKLLAIKY